MNCATATELCVFVDVDDPAKCHSHSKLPTSWPSMEEILDYVKQTRHLVSCEKSFQSVAELAGTNTMAKDGTILRAFLNDRRLNSVLTWGTFVRR
jgi:hypothetical protein